MKKIVFILLIILLNPCVYGNLQNIPDTVDVRQDSVQHRSGWQIGLRFDLNSVIETVLLDPGYYPEYLTRFHTYSDYAFSPIGIYVPVRYNYNNEINFEIRPGIVMSGELLTSVELGINCYYYPFDEDIYIISGFEIAKHTDFFTEPMHFHPLLSVKRSVFWNKFYNSLSLGFGYRWVKTHLWILPY